MGNELGKERVAVFLGLFSPLSGRHSARRRRAGLLAAWKTGESHDWILFGSSNPSMQYGFLFLLLLALKIECALPTSTSTNLHSGNHRCGNHECGSLSFSLLGFDRDEF